jgi:hypothetical protein
LTATVLVCLFAAPPSSGGGIMQQIENWVFFLFISLIRAGSPMFFGTKTVWRVPFVDVQG